MFGKFSLVGVASLLAIGVANAEEQRTVIIHDDGSTTTVVTDRQGTFAERSNGGNHSSGGTDKDTHDRMVREHTDPGDKVRREK